MPPSGRLLLEKSDNADQKARLPATVESAANAWYCAVSLWFVMCSSLSFSRILWQISSRSDNQLVAARVCRPYGLRTLVHVASAAEPTMADSGDCNAALRSGTATPRCMLALGPAAHHP